jgi:hypothetical protein
MKALLSISALAATIFILAGCNPIGPKPMVDRLSDEDHKAITESWNKALTPPDKLDRQAFLDVLIYTQAYQVGVDRLTFRSEKAYSDGTVVMEIHFDRAKPGDDRFEVTIRDKAGKEMRHLVYNRKEVESTFAELSNQNLAQNRGPNDPPLAPDDTKKREDVQKRLAAIEQFFPKRDEAKDGAKK